MDNIKWIARVGQSKYNRGSGVGYRLGKSGQRLYVAYTASTTMHRVSKAAALNMLANMAAGNRSASL